MNIYVKRRLPESAERPAWRAASLPGRAVTDKAHRAARVVACGIECPVPEQHRNLHSSILNFLFTAWVKMNSLDNVMTNAPRKREKFVTVMIAGDRHIEFKMAAELRGARLSTLIHQFTQIIWKALLRLNHFVTPEQAEETHERPTSIYESNS